jgi:transcriptional regulator with XRE-family HTH domain
MTFAYSDLTPKELETFGCARARDLAFNAVRALWKRRRSQGMTQNDLAAKIGRNPAWVSRNLQGPGNWTLRTIGAFVVALNGELEIKAHALEDPPDDPGPYGSAQAAKRDGSNGNQVISSPKPGLEPPRRLGIAIL